MFVAKKVLPVLILCLLVNITQSNKTETDDKVLLLTNKVVDKIYVPVAKYPLLSWMEIQAGRYPNSKIIKKEVQIGQPISIVVYVQDHSRLYDMYVGDCEAFHGKYDERTSVRIYPVSDLHKEKLLSWTKETDLKGNTVLFSTFPAFKLPDRKTLNITCTLEICYNKC